MPGERLLLLAQSPVLRSGIRAIFNGSLRIGRTFESSNALDAAVAAADAHPDLIIVQDSLPGVTGFTAVRMLRQLEPKAKILLLSDRLRDEDYVRAIRHGADALIPAAIDPTTFVETVRGVLGGRYLAFDLVLSSKAGADPSTTAIDRLSAHELATLDGIVRGVSFQEIAQLLTESEQFVEMATASLIAKLDASDLTTAIVASVRLGIVDLSDHLPAHDSSTDPVASSPT